MGPNRRDCNAELPETQDQSSLGQSGSYPLTWFIWNVNKNIIYVSAVLRTVVADITLGRRHSLTRSWAAWPRKPYTGGWGVFWGGIEGCGVSIWRHYLMSGMLPVRYFAIRIEGVTVPHCTRTEIIQMGCGARRRGCWAPVRMSCHHASAPAGFCLWGERLARDQQTVPVLLTFSPSEDSYGCKTIQTRTAEQGRWVTRQANILNQSDCQPGPWQQTEPSLASTAKSSCVCSKFFKFTKRILAFKSDKKKCAICLLNSPFP